MISRKPRLPDKTFKIMANKNIRTRRGDRVQYSVFECILDKNLLDKMADRIDKIVVEKEDSVRIYCLCANCEREIKVIGKGKLSKNEDVYII